jgi:2OG-Fe(II) oxygenase superfamily
VRRVAARDDSSGSIDGNELKADRADLEGQISIHLPHNSLLVMHAEMQEEWKHSIAPAQVIDPHPIAGNKRINITYRWYRDHLHPKFTPRCKCGVACVLRCVQRKKDNRGRYMWNCHTHYTPGQEGFVSHLMTHILAFPNWTRCSYFEWAEFDDDGLPPWAQKMNSHLTEANVKGS